MLRVNSSVLEVDVFSFFAWSLSFYPQIALNIRRRSTVGSIIDFPTINVLGFLLYFLQNVFLYYSPVVRAQYAARNPRAPEPTVRFNDVAFAAHAIVLTLLLLSQFFKGIWGFKQSRTQRVSTWIMSLALVCILGVLLVLSAVLRYGSDDARGWAWIDVVYAMGYGKLAITTVKYMPQVWLNYRRKSTTGWSIYQILLDVVGGVLSISQLLIDSALQGDWSGVTGNPVKLGLGNVSILFDTVFLVQHYVLYRGRGVALQEEDRGLLAPEDGNDHSS